MEGKDEEKEVVDMVMSEIHLGCPPDAQSSFSRFTIFPPLLCRSDLEISVCDQLEADEEGDLNIPRKRTNEKRENDTIVLHHHVVTDIPRVGLQIWKASLLLGDFVLHSLKTSNNFDNMVAMELGAGTGMVGILAARAAKTVFITDYDLDVLDNCFRNTELNRHSFKYSEMEVRVRQLDWKTSWPPSIFQEKDNIKRLENKYGWTLSDLEILETISVILAADVVYSDDLTNAFFDILQKIMPPKSGKVLYLSLEKRYNFTMEDFDIVANGYDYFRTFFEEIPEAQGEVLAVKETSIKLPHLVGRRIDTEKIAKYIQEYDRGKDMELWEIRTQEGAFIRE